MNRISGTTNGVNTSTLDQLVKVSHQGYFIFNLARKSFDFVNRAFELVVGKNGPEIYQNPDLLLTVIHPEDKAFLHQCFQELLKKGSLTKIEFRIIPDENKDSVKWICLGVYLIKQRDSLCIAGYTHDITKDKDYQCLLLKLNERKDTILEVLSHDLAGPLGRIKSLAIFLEEEIGTKIEAKHLQLIKCIQECSKNGMDVINGFIEQEFLESVQAVLQKRRIDLVQKMLSIIESYKQNEEFISKRFDLKPSEESVYVEVDELKFMQAINNLISNSIKFTKDDGTITIFIEDKGTNILLTIRDDGIGIPKEMHQYLFDKFTKARRHGLKGEKSVGLGMSIVKTIIELHKGKIWFESEELKGTVFYIWLPKF